MGNDNGGPILHEVVQRPLHLAFRLGIQGGGRLVQNQDGGVLQKRPGNGEPLLLAAGKPHPGLADHGVEAPRQGLDKVQGIGGTGRRPHLGLGGIAAAIHDVVAHRIVEENGLLGHHGELPAQAVQGQPANVLAVNQNGA